MIPGWTAEEDQTLRARYPQALGNPEEHRKLEKEFGRKWGTIHHRASKLGLTQSRGADEPIGISGEEKRDQARAKRWSVDMASRLTVMCERQAQPSELMATFPGFSLKEIIAEADRVSADTCYLKNRETLMKSIDIKLDVNLDMDLNFRTINVRCGQQ